jgi:hypothetical protein
VGEPKNLQVLATRGIALVHRIPSRGLKRVSERRREEVAALLREDKAVAARAI